MILLYVVVIILSGEIAYYHVVSISNFLQRNPKLLNKGNDYEDEIAEPKSGIVKNYLNNYVQSITLFAKDSFLERRFKIFQLEGSYKESTRMNNVAYRSHNSENSESSQIVNNTSEHLSVVVVVSTETSSCSGNLITTRNALTSASCVTISYTVDSERHMKYIVLKPEHVMVRYGSHYSSTGGDVSFVKNVRVHPDFLKHDEIPHYKGVAVLTLMDELDKNIAIAKIHPPMARALPTPLIGEVCKVDARIPSQDNIDNMGKSTRLNVIIEPHSTCKEFYSSKTESSEHICSRALTETCTSTNGGGLFCYGKLVAIVGPGEVCLPGNPNIFQRVDNLQDFINCAALDSRSVINLGLSLILTFKFFITN